MSGESFSRRMEARSHVAVQDFFEVDICALGGSRKRRNKSRSFDLTLKMEIVNMLVQTLIIGEQSSLLRYNQ